MQIVDGGLLAVHNLDEHTSQLWDVKVNVPHLWNAGLLKDHVGVDTHKASAGKYLMELIEKEETKANDFAYKFVNQPLQFQFHQ
jgi:hypothetical protein